MKYQLIIFLLLFSSAIFAQQEELRVKVGANYSNPQMYNVGTQGTVCVIPVSNTKWQVNYFSADGKDKWASENIRFNGRHLSFDDAGFVVYSLSTSAGMTKTTSTIQFLRYDFAKKTATEGEIKLKEVFITMMYAKGKLWYLSESVSANGNGLVKIYLTAADPKTLEPLGESKLISGLPEIKQKRDFKAKFGAINGSVELYWTLAGYDDNHLLFYGKKTDITNGKIRYEFIKTDYSGKKITNFNLDVALTDNKHVHRTNVLRNINERLESYSSEQYSTPTFTSPGEVDPGNFGACLVDLGNSAIYCYGTYGHQPDDASAQPVGYYVQKYNMTGERIWHYQTTDDFIKKSWAYSYAAPEKVHMKVRSWPSVPTRLVLNSANGRVMLCDYPFNMFSVDSLGTHPEFYAIPTLSEKEREEESQNAFWSNQTLRELCPMHQKEVLSAHLTEALFGAAEGNSLKNFASKNEKNAPKYIVQQLQNGLRVMNYDGEKEECVVWRFGE